MGVGALYALARALRMAGTKLTIVLTGMGFIYNGDLVLCIILTYALGRFQ